MKNYQVPLKNRFIHLHSQRSRELPFCILAECDFFYIWAASRSWSQILIRVYDLGWGTPPHIARTLRQAQLRAPSTDFNVPGLFGKRRVRTGCRDIFYGVFNWISLWFTSFPEEAANLRSWDEPQRDPIENPIKKLRDHPFQTGCSSPVWHMSLTRRIFWIYFKFVLFFRE